MTQINQPPRCAAQGVPQRNAIRTRRRRDLKIWTRWWDDVGLVAALHCRSAACIC